MLSSRLVYALPDPSMPPRPSPVSSPPKAWTVFIAGCLLTLLIYAPGLSGSWLFDDYPNIVDNKGVQPTEFSLPALVRAALSSSASDFKRPLASFSFAVNYLLSGGLHPSDMKLTNLLIHLTNGLLVFLLLRRLLEFSRPEAISPQTTSGSTAELLAAIIASAWLILPINLTAVLYVVQRMESMANDFVLLGLIGYFAGREQMWQGRRRRGLALVASSLTLPAAAGILAKETAVMLPFYALLLEWILFGFAYKRGSSQQDRWIIALYGLVLVLPLVLGLAWLWPQLMRPASWATRNFNLPQRLLSEARIVWDYIAWSILPSAHGLSFYHDDYPVSTGWTRPWTTLPAILGIILLICAVPALRRRQPLAALGLAWFLGAQLLTGTVLPLELVYEHRNYFASMGLLLILVPWLAALPLPAWNILQGPAPRWRQALLVLLLLNWAGHCALTAWAWGQPLQPLRLAQTLALRAPNSPRAQYELGRTYIVYSHYNPASPYTRAAYPALERAAALPASSILPQQALIFMNARMGLPLKHEWWDSMISKLRDRPPGVQDESSLAALATCARDRDCPLPTDRMQAAFQAAMAHAQPDARLESIYADYAWSVLHDRPLGLALIHRAIANAPKEPAYRISLIRMLLHTGRSAEARTEWQALARLNIGGRLNGDLADLRQGLTAAGAPP